MVRNHLILDEVVHHELIRQIWWNDSISHTSTNYLFVRNRVVMNQLISFCYGRGYFWNS